MYLSPAILPLAHRLIRVRETLTVRAVLQAVCMVTLFFSCFLLIEAIAERVPALYAPQVSEAMLHHGTIGVRLNTENSIGRPVYATSPQALQLPVPNRVVSVHDSTATNWDYQTGYHWQYIDQEAVDNMVALGVMALTERTNTVDAWNDLIPYQPGEEVVIKLNFNNAGCSDSDKMDGYSEPVNAAIDGLVSIGVPPENIWITDPSRIMPPRFIYGIANSPHASVAQCPAGEKIRPAQVFVDAEHLINIPLLKSHTSYPTLVLKNHYGSVIYRDNTLESMHAYFEQSGNTGGCDLERENILAVINDNPHIRDKTRLVIGDGLFGNPYNNWSSVERWDIFGNDDPNILFFGADPVAVESVMMEYIVAERGNQDHGYLHAAANLGLGVHDHWDSFENKHYSAIDYQIIDLDYPQVDLPPRAYLPMVLSNYPQPAISRWARALRWSSCSCCRRGGLEVGEVVRVRRHIPDRPGYEQSSSQTSTRMSRLEPHTHREKPMCASDRALTMNGIPLVFYSKANCYLRRLWSECCQKGDSVRLTNAQEH
jgi:hypothetical protein